MTAQKWAANSEVVAEAARVTNQLMPDNWHREDGIEQQMELDRAERLHWDAIPAALRGPRPKVSELIWQAGPYTLYVRRLGGQWKVVGIKPVNR